MSDADNGNVLRVTKASPNVHLDWSLDGTSGPFVLKRSLSFTFSNPAYLGPGQTTKTFDDAVLNNATAYAYEAFERTLTDTLYFYHADHLGTPIAMTNGAGALVWRAEHTPFGGIYALTVGTTANNLRFPGQYYDSETGLAQNWNRDYSARVGRFYENDPWRSLPPRQYLYVNNNPLKHIDSKGLFSMVGFPAQLLDPPIDAFPIVAAQAVLNALSGLRHCCGCALCSKAAETLEKATVVYDESVTTCGETTVFDFMSGTVRVGPSAFSGLCGPCPAKTIAHEALHLAGAGEPDAYKYEGCATCK
jgi:RHS repeat-associated protein